MKLVLPLPLPFFGFLSYCLLFTTDCSAGARPWSAGSRKGEGTAFSDDDTEDTTRCVLSSKVATASKLNKWRSGPSSLSSTCSTLCLAARCLLARGSACAKFNFRFPITHSRSTEI
ncbi:hypothetical protein BHE74_00025662 [Ensete ventricosum]|nr:hypothetical protein GW17_00033066 [Ensete ventricosum]RWW66928.1 hypothetical protein BHE74_00025662 [Ensete ventricosum]RZR88292.1 hypothetical protein BHM03_00015835 [Ensete ventricosum]